MNDPYGPMRCMRPGFILLAMHDPVRVQHLGGY
jgi:hypothetical protein